uniref:protein BCAP-like isoform X2 n=1 Tax=Ciona intestinalis TaxID=7719 RepID=UPI000EF50BB5|nr:protein BCAP-like isoform X2 [Ciona intestinalis]|eukprot:XP_026690083.1 protein BCAP-like isoform X2 [Ciona intestinalis]
MSRTPRTSRAKSSGVRPLGAMRLVQGNPGLVTHKNDPALHINQIRKSETDVTITQPNRDFAKEREYQEKERKLRDQIASLQNQILQLKQEIKQKNESYNQLQETVLMKDKQHEESLLQMEGETNKVKLELNESKAAELEATKQLKTATLDFEAKLKKIIEEYEKKLKDLAEEKDKELEEKDVKFGILKKRMAESLGKNSMERQQQLEELKRDLIKQSQEAKELQHKLKHFQLKPKQCENCSRLEEKLEEKILQIRLKEKTINDLQGIGRKMQLQLHQQYRQRVLKEKHRSEKHRMLCLRAGIKPISPVNCTTGCQMKKEGSYQQKHEL